jgi:glycerophosphoryl diester phosphodiesterase
LVIGHRGSPRLAPENTLPSFEWALAAGADLVELDYRQSKDSVPMVIHDAELDRTTDARRRWGRRRIRVESKTASEIQCLDAGGWFKSGYEGTRVPLLSEALEWIGEKGVALIERKAGRPEDLLELLRSMGLINRVIVQSFDWEFLGAMHALAPEQALAALGPAQRLASGRKPIGIPGRLTRPWITQAINTRARIVVWNRRISKRAVRLAHERGLKVWVYTVDDARLARRLLKAGVDGIITNVPGSVRGLLSRFQDLSTERQSNPTGPRSELGEGQSGWR